MNRFQKIFEKILVQGKPVFTSQAEMAETLVKALKKKGQEMPYSSAQAWISNLFNKPFNSSALALERLKILFYYQLSGDLSKAEQAYQKVIAELQLNSAMSPSNNGKPKELSFVNKEDAIRKKPPSTHVLKDKYSKAQSMLVIKNNDMIFVQIIISTVQSYLDQTYGPGKRRGYTKSGEGNTTEILVIDPEAE